MSKALFPVTRTEDARAVIEELARRKGTFTNAFRQEAEDEARHGRQGMLQVIEGSEEIREDLARALNIISTDLYSHRARFLMEVIQNADDNEYAKGETPTISITVFPKYVKIECNEEGFSRENIQALCRTGRSSKKPGKGYTGEKGIGFKSVFKLAERAHIRSFPYHFQLDKTRELGMITPQWDQKFFDRHERKHQTTIILDHICDPSADFSTALESDIDAIDPVLILFLRRIERIQLTLFKSSLDDEPVISKHFRRVAWVPDSGIVSLKDEDDDKMRRFYKQRLAIKCDATEPRRPDVRKTDIVLAFPLKKTSGVYIPSIRMQNFAFAYLPLGDFGFKFAIQADFLTTSNRESVDEDNAWNKNIVDAIPRAFEAAVDNFNGGDTELDELAKLWPLYLSNKTSGRSKYWRSITKGINKRISEARVIKDRTGNFRQPKHLTFLDWAHDRNGEPMFNHSRHYVSADYPDSVREALLSLGVTAPTWSWLCDNLKELHNANMLSVRMQSKEWCSDLAKVILEPMEPRGDKKYVADLRSIPLIPLADGTWKCPPSKDEPIYFPASLGTTIPPGLPLLLIDEEACTCPKRRKLFRLQGVKECDVPSVVERILDYHTKFKSADDDHLIAQLEYLYKMREHLRPHDMEKIFFVCSTSELLQQGVTTYADMSVDGDLQQLFSGYSEAHFLDSRYSAALDSFESTKLAEWLNEKAGVALRPRFIALHSSELHEDFAWILEHKTTQVLALLRQYWSHYSKEMTDSAKRALGRCKFRCKSGGRTALRNTYLPLPTLLEKVQAFGDVDDCHFLALPSDNPMDWKFLSDLRVGLDDGLDFYLWILNQSGFKNHTDVPKSKNLYLAIQSRVFSPYEEAKVKEAFGNCLINLPHEKFERLRSCAWNGPTGFRPERTLRQVYGHELDRLFQGILRVPSVTSAEAEGYLQELSSQESTTMADVAEVYVFLHKHCATTFISNDDTACIAVPTSSGAVLEWKTPAQCVWDDVEFSQNELQLESKTAIRHLVEKHAPTSKSFFTDILKLPNAGLDELLADLVLMQKQGRDDPRRVYRLYERIESCRRSRPQSIKTAFERNPLVFLRGFNNQSSKWVSLETCIWTRSVLRNKHVLMHSLNQYRDLFRYTLQVPNASVDMLVTDLIKSSMCDPNEDEDAYQYTKELLQELARLPQNHKELRQLNDKKCWPCRTPAGQRELCSVGNFSVNDRDDLFEMFSGTQIILDFDFETSKTLADLLCNQGCDSFLSKKVVMETEACTPLKYDHEFVQDFRSRANALVKYLEHRKFDPPYQLRSLLENIEVWVSAEIKTYYTLGNTTVTKSEGGSSVKFSTGENDTVKLDVYFSADRHLRDCALVTDFPGQLVMALGLELDDLFDLHSILTVPLFSLKALLIRKGITGGNAENDSGEILLAAAIEDISQEQSNSSEISSDEIGNDESTDPAPSIVIESAHASASSVASRMTPRPYLRDRTSSTSTMPQLHVDGGLSVPSDDDPRERPVTPRSTAAGLYSTDNRTQNRARLEAFARDAETAAFSRPGRSRGQSGSETGAFDMGTLRETLETVEPAPVSTLIHDNHSPRRRTGLIPNRSEGEMARDFEVGFLGEQFVYTLLRDTIQLPNFTAEENWTSSLRSRAGHSTFGRETSDFTYKDTQGVLTRHFLQMQHSYVIPEWLSTACDNTNTPLYRLEVKSTTSQDPTTPFFMGHKQHNLAKKLRVTSETPAEIYVVLRISGLDALEDGATHRPQWRVYLDPYTLGEEGVLNFVAPTYAVTPST